MSDEEVFCVLCSVFDVLTKGEERGQGIANSLVFYLYFFFCRTRGLWKAENGHFPSLHALALSLAIL